MIDYLRFGGAQIPCTRDLERNVSSIKSAIDWAVKNQVEYIVTPEGCLSGYIPDFDTHNGRTLDDLKSALTDIEKYIEKTGVGLCLGTLFIEEEDTPTRRNQLRFYDKDGSLISVTNKTHTVGYDQVKPGRPEEMRFAPIVTEGNNNEQLIVPMSGFICNDLWGGSFAGEANLPAQASNFGSKLFIHATNGVRGHNELDYEIKNEWHNANLRIITHIYRVPIITADNACAMNGDEYEGPTSSESGVLIAGRWVTNVPRTGTQYFYYDFNKYQLVSKYWGWYVDQHGRLI